MSPQRTQNSLAKFSVEKDGDDYRLHIEDEAGEAIELKASYEQIEVLADTLDELLGADDSIELDGDDSSGQ